MFPGEKVRRMLRCFALVLMLMGAFGSTVYGQNPLIANLHDEFYQREGLELMPRVDYESMMVVNVRDFGARGDGVSDDKAAFSAAVARLLESGVGGGKGGIIFIPKGVYVFSEPDDTLAYWNLNPTIKPGMNSGDPEFRRISNIHFVGEGEDSIIRFKFRGIDQGNLFDSESAKYAGWYLGGCDNISLRDLSLTVFGTVDHRYFYNPARTVSSGSDAYTSHGIHYVRVNIDQGAIGIQSQALVEDIWVVDSKVRNTTADGIAFYGASKGRALYNYVENSGDDAYALWADSIAGVQGQDYVVLGNTALEVRFGRGILMKGQNALVKDNWVEKTVGAGLVSSASKDYVMSGELYAIGNTLIRNNMSGRPDNLAVTNKNRGGVFVWGTYSTMYYLGNKVYGSALDGFNFGSAMIEKLVIEGNEIAGVERHGINLEKASRVGDTIIRNNSFDIKANETRPAGEDSTMENVCEDIKSDGKIMGKVFEGNVRAKTSYVDVYAPFRFESAESVKVPKVLSLPADLPVFNVRDFGAVGDGCTDDRIAFLKAIAALPADGAVLRIPAGNYFIGKGKNEEHTQPFTAVRQHLLLEGKSNIHIAGEGQVSTLIFADADMQGLSLVSVQRATIRDIGFSLALKPSLRHNRALLCIAASRDIAMSGIRTDNSSGPGIYADCVTGISIKNSTIHGSGQYGIRLSGVVSAAIEDNLIADTRDHGIFVSHFGGVSREPLDISITRNSILGTAEGIGIAIGNGTRVVVNDNTVRDTYMAGISIFQPTVAYPSRDVTVSDNLLEHCNHGSNTYTMGAISLIMGSTTGFAAFSDVELKVLSNRIVDTPKDGIHIDRYIADRVTVKGNRISAAEGATFSMTKRTIIRNLTLEDNLP